MHIHINLTEEIHNIHLQQSYQNITPWQDINTNIIQYASITKNIQNKQYQKKLLNKCQQKNINNLFKANSKKKSNFINLLEKICTTNNVSKSSRYKETKQRAFQLKIPQQNQNSYSKMKNNNVIFSLNKVLKNQCQERKIRKQQPQINKKNERLNTKLSINTIINGIDQYDRIKTEIKHSEKIRYNKNATQFSKRIVIPKGRYKNMEQILHLPEITKRLSQKYNIEKYTWTIPYSNEKNSKIN